MIRLETVRALWFMPVEHNRSDWLAAVCLEEDGLVLRYRHRYYQDDKLDHTSGDRKVWYEVRGPQGASESEYIDKTRHMLGVLSQFADGAYTEIIVGEHDMQWLAQEMQKYDWCHVECQDQA